MRVLRQDEPGEKPYWQPFNVAWEPDMNCISVLEKIAAKPVDGRRPQVAAGRLGVQLPGRGLRGVHDAGQRPGAPGLHRPGRPALADRPAGIELRPMTKFPVLRDLVVDRSRMFTVLEKIQAWVPVDSYLDMGPGLRQSQQDAGNGLRFQQVHGLRLLPGGLPAVSEDRAALPPRRNARAIRRPQATGRRPRATSARFAIGQVELFNLNPTGKMLAQERLDVLVGDRRHRDVQFRAELRAGVSEGDSLDHGDRPGRPRRHAPRRAAMVQ